MLSKGFSEDHPIFPLAPREGGVGGQRSPAVPSWSDWPKTFLAPRMRGPKNILGKNFAALRFTFSGRHRIRDVEREIFKMTEALVSIRLRLRKALFRFRRLIGMKAQGWSNRAGFVGGLPNRSAESRLSPFHNYYPAAGAAPEIPEGSGDLPEAYGETRLVLLPVHPYLIHAYWEVTPKDLERVRHGLGEGHETAKPVLRFFDITYIEFDGANAHSHFDVEIDLQANNWKVHLWSPEKSYIAELGLKSAAGEYSPVTRSNVAQTPRAWPSAREETRYLILGDEYRDDEPDPNHSSPDDPGSYRGVVVEEESIPVDERAGYEKDRAGSPQVDKKIEPVKAREKMKGAELAARAGMCSGQSEIPRPADALEEPSNIRTHHCGFQSEERFLGEAHGPKEIDFTELGEQKFTSGLSSRSRRTDSG